MHQIQEFGHAESLVRVEGYEPPKKPKVERKPRRKKKATDEVTDTGRKRTARKESK
jgi:hypothetical protein